MTILVLPAVIPEKKGGHIDISKELEYSINYIKEKSLKLKKYDDIKIIDNTFLSENDIDIEIYKTKFPPNIDYYNKSWFSAGWQIWKPLALQKIIQNLDEGEIIFFHDSNIIKYPFYEDNLQIGSKSISKFVEKYKKKSLFLFYECYKPLSFDIKYESFQYFNISKNYLYKCGIWAGSLIIRNDDFSRNFINSWCQAAKTETISQSEYKYCSKVFYPRFCQHAVDQSVLNLYLFSSFNTLKPHIKFLRTYKRRISFEKRKLFLYTIRDYYKFLIWFSKDIYLYFNYLLFGKNNYYQDF